MSNLAFDRYRTEFQHRRWESTAEIARPEPIDPSRLHMSSIEAMRFRKVSLDVCPVFMFVTKKSCRASASISYIGKATATLAGLPNCSLNGFGRRYTNSCSVSAQLELARLPASERAKTRWSGPA